MRTKRFIITLQRAKELAMNNYGQCLSNFTTIKSRDKILWKCNNVKHKAWMVSFNNVQRGKWCPNCISSVSKPQKEIYSYLIDIFPQFNIILNDTQIIRPLDLDIYIPELNLGIEYDGEYWHYSDWAIKEGSLERMKYKNIVCLNKNIKLMRVRENKWINYKEMELQKLIDLVDQLYKPINICRLEI